MKHGFKNAFVWETYKKYRS